MDAAGTSGGDPTPDAPDPATHGPDPSDPSAGAATRSPPGRLAGAEAARAHATLAVGLALCGVAFWFELHRALSGNGLSWAYVFEWPLFAAFAVYMWWNVLHGGRAVGRPRRAGPGPAVDPRYAGMLQAWEAHQRELRASQADPGGGAGAADRTTRGADGPSEA